MPRATPVFFFLMSWDQCAVDVFLGVVVWLGRKLGKNRDFFPSLGVPKGFRFSLNFLFKTD
jgi:hypothetical protein